jgi:Putative prokaryotic signal transducing protein
MEENWVKVYSTSILAQAEIIKAMLVENEVEAVVLNKQDSAFTFGQAEVYVPPYHAELAMKLLKQEIQGDE